jgi:hypothetical protein
MERGLTMLAHAAVIAALLFAVMKYILNQRTAVAEDRSLLIAALALVYMLLFGHNLPKRINSNIM